MKKLSILALAAVLVVFFTMPAAALENEFGGYWRTRFYSQKYFTGYDAGDRINDAGDRAEDDTVKRTDTRTRLYYTAKINDNLKFVNKFEYDARWGGTDQGRGDYGKVGADGVAVEVKNSYVDFNLGPVNTTIGVQPFSLFRDFFISDDASGIIARWKAMDNFVLAGSWLKSFEGGDGTGRNEDLDTYTMTGAFWFNENISIKPSVSWAYASQTRGDLAQNIFNRATANGTIPLAWDTNEKFGETNLLTLGMDFDMTFDKWGAWTTGYFQTGSMEDVSMDTDGDGVGNRDRDLDFKGWLVAAGGNVGFGELGFLGDFGLHGEFFYASGDDDMDANDTDLDMAISPFGSYYWSEIMGYGIFDNQASAGSAADRISNIYAFNVGVDMKPLDKMKVVVDYWWASVAEEDQMLSEEDTLGHEIDLLITYELVEGLNLDLVGAWLFADDGTAADERENEEDPYEYGARISLSF